MVRRIMLYSSLLSLLLFQTMGVAFSQPKAIEEKGPEISLGEINFWVREFEPTTFSLKLLEVHVEIVNKSRRIGALPGSIKVVVVPKEIKYPDGTSAVEFNPSQEETTLALPLPPNAGHIIIFGFSLPEKKPESITFEVQINPPDGEKKTVKWEGG
jgi:hypothetical protein